MVDHGRYRQRKSEGNGAKNEEKMLTVLEGDKKKREKDGRKIWRKSGHDSRKR